MIFFLHGGTTEAKLFANFRQICFDFPYFFNKNGQARKWQKPILYKHNVSDNETIRQMVLSFFTVQRRQ